MPLSSYVKRLFIYLEVRKFYLSISVICLLLVTACKKDKNILGVDVQPEEDAVGSVFSDTSTIQLFTIKQDSTRSFNLSEKYLGVHQDGVFGQTKAELITRMVIPGNVANTSFGEDPQVTSAEINLVASSDIIGKTGALINYKVYQLNTNLDISKVYQTTFKDYTYNPTPIADITDSLRIVNGKVVLKIPVNNLFAQSIISNPNALVNNTTFINTYKGLVIKVSGINLNPVNTPGVLVKYNLSDSETGLVINYQNGSPSSTKTTNTYRFAFSGDDNLRINLIDYNSFNGGNIFLRKQLSGDSLASAQNVFLKGLGNMRIKIKLPYLLNYAKNKTVAINRAELVFKVDEGLNGVTDVPRPLTLALLAIDSTGKESLVLDQFTNAAINNYGGSYDIVKKEYRFNIAREIQAVLSSKVKTYGFYLVMASPLVTEAIRRDNFAQRLVLGGAKNSIYAPKLNLSYIPFNK
jgi:hypothetical protein